VRGQVLAIAGAEINHQPSRIEISAQIPGHSIIRLPVFLCICKVGQHTWGVVRLAPKALKVIFGFILRLGVGSVLRSFCTKEVTPIPGTNVLWV
jgi:hypothetical protein